MNDCLTNENVGRSLALTRDLIGRLPPRTDKRGPAIVEPPAENFCQSEADRILSEIPADGALWVFAAGSLIWNPRFPEVERQPARVEGWHRAFCFRDRRRRGNPDAPGLMMSLDEGGACNGFVIRMDPSNQRHSLRELLSKEPPIPTQWVDATRVDGNRVKAIAFTASRDFPLYTPEPPEDEVVEMLATAVGHIGTMAEYLLNMVEHLEAAGAHDPYLWRLQERLAERLAAMTG